MRSMQKTIIFTLVFFSGFANLATEIIGPRLVASLFGSTTVVWAIIISVTLLGISIGYYLGGRVPFERVNSILPLVMVVNACWLLAISWIIWWIPNQISGVDLQNAAINYGLITLISVAAFLAPAALFSTVSPVAITLLSRDTPTEQVSKTVGNVYALGTIGSVSGALAAAFYLIPWVGLSSSLRLFAVLLVLFSAYFWLRKRSYVVVAALALCLFIPQPDLIWDSDLTLLLQREGYYQTIRIYTDDSTFIRFHLGPVYESEMDLRTFEPRFGYAKRILDSIGDIQGKKILMIGGAGHSLTRALENRGATLTEVEIDPIVVQVSDKFFGPIEGEVVVQDGRTYVNQAGADTFDYVVVDAFNGPASIPPQLTTLEFFESVEDILKPDGKLIYNFIGYHDGPKAESYFALATTMSAAMEDVRVMKADVPIVQNIVFVASPSALLDSDLERAPANGVLLTDDLNPVEIFFERAQ